MFSVKGQWDKESKDPPHLFAHLGDFEQESELFELLSLYLKPLTTYFHQQDLVLQPEVII